MLPEELAAAINELLKLEPVRHPNNTAAEATTKAQEENAKPPADDAPLKELIAYWQSHGSDEHSQKPSDRVRQRLLDACEERPWLLARLLSLLPETDDAKDRLFQLYQNERDEAEQWKTQLHEWLKYNSRYFLDELRAEVRVAVAKGEDSNAVDFLARLDWETAKPLLEASPNLRELAILHEQAATRGETALAEACRTRLKAIVNDSSVGELRLVALQSLLRAEWPGQEDWFLSLFSNSSLTGAEALLQARRVLETMRMIPDKPGEKSAAMDKIALALSPIFDKGAERGNLLALAMNTNTKRFVPAVIKLLGQADRLMHNAAVEALTSYLVSEPTETEEPLAAARALVPWLTDPQWSDSFHRMSYLGMLTRLKVPESVPGLIAVLDNDADPLARAAAAEALSLHRTPSAAPALRRALEHEADESLRESLITTLFLCGGISDEEAAAAIEAYARKLATPGGEEAIKRAKESEAAEPLPLKISIGRILDESDRLALTEGLAALLFERVKTLRAKETEVAEQILHVIQGAPLPIVRQFLARRIGEGWVDADALALALETRNGMQKDTGSELLALLNRDGYAAGVAAVLLDDGDAARDVLKGKDSKAQLALLACARYLRSELPIELVAGLLADKALAGAVESYLIVEDSAVARQLVWARHAGEALILGEGIAPEQNHSNTTTQIAKLEERLRNELLQRPGGLAQPITEMYTLFQANQAARLEIRIKAGQAELRKYAEQGDVRWQARALLPAELAELQSFTARPEVEDLKPSTALEDVAEGLYEYLHLTRNGGRRILTGAPHRLGRNATLHEELGGLFYRLSHRGEFKVHYAIEDKLPGVEVVLAENGNQFSIVCREGGELRVLSLNAEKARPTPSSDWQPEWRAVVNGQLGGLTDEPAACRLSNMFNATRRIRQTRHEGIEGVTPQFSKDGTLVFARSFGEEPGIWRVLPGGEPEQLLEGRYFAPLLTPDGQWLLAVKANIDGGSTSQLVRYNLKTQQESVIKLPKDTQLQPLAYIEAHGKVLLGSSQYGLGASSATSKQSHFLLDPNSGAMQPVQGDFRPLYEPTMRPLQTTGKPHEFWLALPNREEGEKSATLIGRYDSRSFVFQTVLMLPGLHIRSEEMWVDATANRLWLIYQGHLLRLPLAASAK